MLPLVATLHLELLAGEIVTRLILEADQHLVFFDARVDDPEFDAQFPVSNALRQGVAEAGFENHPEPIATVKSQSRGTVPASLKMRVPALGSIASKEAEAPFERPGITPIQSDILIAAGQHKLRMVVDSEQPARFALSDIDHPRIGLLLTSVKRFRHWYHASEGMCYRKD
jgi:hypothetical protein